MEAIHRSMLIDAVENAFKETGYELYPSAIWLKAWVERQQQYLEASQSRESLDAFFSSAGDAEEARVLQFVALLSALPSVVRGFADKLIVKSAEGISKPPAGRREIPLERKRQIIATVGRLHTQGVRMGIAQSRVAQQLGLSKRTVQRVWQHRKALQDQPFQTMEDILEFLRPGEKQ